jgi:thiamine biosynthesis lipoprotein
VVTVGARPDGSPWRIGIQHPRREGALIGAVAVAGQSVVTAGDYQRTFTDRAGNRRHHILDPATGFPAEAGLISVTIVTGDDLAADVLSTMVFVAGPAWGLRLLSSLPRADAVLVDTDLRVSITPGLRDRFRAAAGVDVTVLD